MNTCAVTDVGLERKINQDYVYYSQTPIGNLPNLFIVADGMGGHKAGDMASRFTVENLVSLIEKSPEKNPITVIDNSIRVVNELLLQKASESEDYTGMGTTLVVATITDNVLNVANVGDSRLYVIGDELQQITRDHSLVEEMISIGQLQRKYARTHKQKNVITRAIGGVESVMADFFQVDLKPEDKVLMCTDGLTNMIEDNDIKKIVQDNNNTEEAAKQLISVANANGGRDNISVLIIEP